MLSKFASAANFAYLEVHFSIIYSMIITISWYPTTSGRQMDKKHRFRVKSENQVRKLKKPKFFHALRSGN